MKLTEICRIKNLEAIENADRIEKATILGWPCIVKKGLHNINDLILFIYPDTIIPKNLLDSSYVGEEKVRLKTIKMKGIYSAGLVIPLNVLNVDSEFLKEGNDIAELLHITKYEKPIPVNLTGIAKDYFPRMLIEKTDEDNYRSNPETIKELIELEIDLVATLKLDGTSATYIYTKNYFKVCSRNLELEEDENNVYWQMAKKYNILEILQRHYILTGKELAIQGEICGPAINGGNTGVSENMFSVFLIKNVTDNIWYDWDDIREFCEFNSRLNFVKELFRINSKDLNFEDLQNFADSYKYSNNKPAEGLVVRSVKPIKSNTLAKTWISLKVISQPYDQKN